MRYSLLRFLLVQRDIPPLLLQSGYKHPRHSREEYLKEVFGKTFEFYYRQSRYAYAFIGQEGLVLLGRIGRLKSEKIDQGPETGFAETSSPRWHAANFLLNTGNDSDGQKIAFEEIQTVGSPLAVTKGLIENINSNRADAKWEIIVNPITEEQDFWQTVDKYEGKITEMELSFVAPNMFGGRDKTTKVLKTWNEENNMQTASLSLHNKAGALNPDSENVRESLGLITSGGGSAKLKTGKQTVYDSETNVKKESISDEENFPISKETKSRWRNLIKILFRK